MSAGLLFLILAFPLLGALGNLLLGELLLRRVRAAVAVAAVAASALTCLLLWPLAAGEGTRATLFTWLESGTFQVSVDILFDPLSASMTLMVTLVSTLIHLYAAGYMEDEVDTTRFFVLLNLFVFAMLCIVLADNLLLLFLGWEGVGFCSYALIGFWYAEEKNAAAGRKAFLVTRVGDVFFGIALLWLFALCGTLSISAINAQASLLGSGTLLALTLLLLGGACGKSAQLPLMTWLPDAMAGPTPVSALIHAATMVTAGVYLLCRLFPLVSLSPTGMMAIAAVGALSALYAASCALAQREIKRVLAFSTMSQVGFMMLAVGAGAVSAAMFHLFTHAFFKALLFMAAGCVIHLTGGENDITRMGGLRKQSPFVFWLFLAGALCLAGAPLTGGFFSKDEILLADFARATLFYRGIWLLGTCTALLTAIYTFRLVYMVFAGEPRSHFHGHALPGPMRWTLPPLALLALGGGLLNLPPLYGGKEHLHQFLGPLAGTRIHASHAVEWALAVLAVALFFLGWALVHWRHRRAAPEPVGALPAFLLSGWRADRLVERGILRPFQVLAGWCWQWGDGRLIDGTLEGAGRLCLSGGERLRRLATGRLSTYLTALAWGLVVMLGYFAWRIL
ncbi:NADH-quinone oxidoreductase subunit L [Geoalkalibacter sp.]|uniref:NADH-quinone oxidoreductase subunit L n=1 Tax=Geoalkalibacter sp. TaxID=3041440 RepID=UPI00272ECAB9|nr:NADH-quinone oxidoreductase subunit L [Geoalkalibacter sp.]